MNRILIASTSLLLASLACQVEAQVAPVAAPPALSNAGNTPAPKATPVPAPAALPAAASPDTTATRAGTPEPQVLREVTEDDNVRIEELRVRGQTRKLTVQPKIAGMSAYDVLPAEPGREPTRDPKAGQRVWLSLTF